MNPSEWRYIKFCEEAKDLQKIAPQYNAWERLNSRPNFFYAEWDFVSRYGVSGKMTTEHKRGIVHDGDEQIVARDPSCGIEIIRITKIIWLPTQDQLMEMVIDYTEKFPSHNLFHRLYQQLSDTSDMETMDYWRQFYSYCEIWLAYVMKIKYKKYWNKTTWEGR